MNWFPWLGAGLIGIGICVLGQRDRLIAWNARYQASKFRTLRIRNPFDPRSPWAGRILVLWALGLVLIGIVLLISGLNSLRQ